MSTFPLLSQGFQLYLIITISFYRYSLYFLTDIFKIVCCKVYYIWGRVGGYSNLSHNTFCEKGVFVDRLLILNMSLGWFHEHTRNKEDPDQTKHRCRLIQIVQGQKVRLTDNIGKVKEYMRTDSKRTILHFLRFSSCFNHHSKFRNVNGSKISYNNKLTSNTICIDNFFYKSTFVYYIFHIMWCTLKYFCFILTFMFTGTTNVLVFPDVYDGPLCLLFTYRIWHEL